MQLPAAGAEDSLIVSETVEFRGVWSALMRGRAASSGGGSGVVPKIFEKETKQSALVKARCVVLKTPRAIFILLLLLVFF